MYIFDLSKIKKNKITDEYRLHNGDLPVSATITMLGHCEYCGNESGLSDGRGGCISCGAPLPKIKEQTELYLYPTT